MVNSRRFFAVVGVASAILMVMAVFQLTLYMRLDYARQRLEKKYKELVSKNQHLEMVVNQAGDYDKVSDAATEQYSMVFPEQIVYIHAKH